MFSLDNLARPAPLKVPGHGVADAQDSAAAFVNLALGKPAVQSSTGYGGTADRAVDGNTNGDYFAGRSVSHTAENNQPQPW